VKKPGDLAARLGVAAVGIPLVFGALWAGGWVLTALIGLITILGAREFYALARLRGAEPFDLLGSAAAGGLVLLAGADPDFDRFAARAVWVVLGLGAVTLAAGLRARWPGGSPLGAFSSTLGGVVYVGLPLAFVPLLRALGEGIPVRVAPGPAGAFFVPMAFVLLPLLTTWAGDTAAYFVGHAVGRTKLAPSVSPGKTVEGSLGGLAGAVAAAALVASLWLAELPVRGVPVMAAAGIGLAVAVVAQLGDLVESALKREAGVKDSGQLLPGHGGILDRLDALLGAFPLTWLLLTLVWEGA
jgi:phosphatidate cytidylyltransferase